MTDAEIAGYMDWRGPGAYTERQLVRIRRIVEEVQRRERKAMMQLFTDPENQPTQHGTVTVEYMQREIVAEREACAKAAGWLWQQFQDTKDAHERNSLEPFMPGQFGFDQSTVQQSKRMMDAIRARGQA